MWNRQVDLSQPRHLFGSDHVQATSIGRGSEIHGEEGTHLRASKFSDLDLSEVHILTDDQCSRDGGSRVPCAK